MSKTRSGHIVTVVAAGVLFTSGLASFAGAGTATRARALMPNQSATSAEMSAQAASIRLDEYGLTSELQAVHFAFNSATIRREDRRILDANAAWLKANTDQPVALGGAADPRGTEDYNLVLGQRRANAVKSYLVARGVAPDRIAVMSTGEFQQACRDKACWGLDRRVDFLVKKFPRQAP